LTGGSQWLCIPGELYPKFARGKLHGPTCHRDRHYPWRIPYLMPTFARGKPPLPIPVGPSLTRSPSIDPQSPVALPPRPEP
jgi:hypothetical protein